MEPSTKAVGIPWYVAGGWLRTAEPYKRPCFDSDNALFSGAAKEFNSNKLEPRVFPRQRELCGSGNSCKVLLNSVIGWSRAKALTSEDGHDE
jgi:hypothetical protein